MKYMKSKIFINRYKKRLILLGVLVLFVFLSISAINYFGNSKIDKILRTDSYSYLPKEAKNFIKQVYEETGEIILTEKNKEANLSYLNPQYVNYLTLSDDEKGDVGYIPEVYVTDYIYDEVYADSSFPTSYDLRNVNGKNYLTELKNQETLGICWTIASIENAETYLLFKNNKPYDSSAQLFSARQMDYATSKNGLVYGYSGSSTKYIWSNDSNGYRDLAGGGNYFMSSLAMANGITLVDESTLPWNTSKSGRAPGEILDYSKSLYEVDGTIQLPMLDSTATTATINSYNNKIKSYMMQYGGPFVGTYSPTSSCGFVNSDGSAVVKVDDCISVNSAYGHAMQIVGWNDNYSYSYCDNGTTHSNVVGGSCSSGTLVNGTGAWVLRNSWGNDTSYLYLTYDSVGSSIGFITDLKEMSNRTWDNNYHTNPWSSDLLNTTYNEKIFYINAENSEKIEKIKFYAATPGGNYKIYFAQANASAYTEVTNVTVSEQGIVTVDVSDMNLVATNPGFNILVYGSVLANGTSRAYSFDNSISVFTSNINDTSFASVYSGSAYDTTKVLSNTNPLYVSGENYYNFTLTLYTRNIPANAALTYRITDGTNMYNKIATVNDLFLIDGYGGTNFDGRASITYAGGFNMTNIGYGNTFNFEILYNGVVVSKFPIKFSGKNKTTRSNLNVYYNNGTGKFKTVSQTDKTSYDPTFYFKESNVPGIFNKNKYIMSWNTESDGSGTSFEHNSILVAFDMDVYAQWSDSNSYKLNYGCSDSCCYGKLGVGPSSSNLTLGYDEEFTVFENYLYHDNEGPLADCNGSVTETIFLHWTYGDKIFYGGEITKTLAPMQSPFGDEEVELAAVWASDAKVVNFNSNGGSGTMTSINVPVGSAVRIKYNSFIRDGYSFLGWNTMSDGSGTSYNDGGDINTSSDVTLYAQWAKTDLKISFDANGGSGTMTDMNVVLNNSVKLNKNLFTRLGYTFSGWNTANDGRGVSYSNEEEVSLTEDLKLYAQWQANNYTIKFDSNGGSGTMNDQSAIYDKELTLTSNKFTKDGYKFKSWNTKSDGGGITYNDESKVSNLISTGSITLYAIWVLEADYSINEYNVVDSKNYIDNIPAHISLDDYKKNIIVGEGYSFEIDLGSKTNVFTGSKLKILKGNNLVIEYTNIIRGEVTGDGIVNYLDYVNLYNHIQKVKNPDSDKKLLTDVYLEAGDMTGEGTVNYLDYVKIYNLIKTLKGRN